MTDPYFVPESASGNPNSFPEIRGRMIRVDDAGRVSLTDIWRAAGSPEDQRPTDWRAIGDTQKSIKALETHLKSNAGQNGIEGSQGVFHTRRGGIDAGTWAHPNLALQFAGYLSPELRVEIHDVFLRYSLADPTLADEVLQRASDEANEWAARRANSRAQRNALTSTWAQHGVRDRGFADCTNQGYLGLHGRTARELKADRGLPTNAKLRDHFTSDELAVQTLADVAARKRIVATDVYGNDECGKATYRSSRNLRDFLDREDQDIRATLQDRRR